MSTILAQAKALEAEMTLLRRELHRCPETGADLPETRAVLKQALEAAGLRAEECAGSLTLLIGNADAGNTVMLRADMDALPMREKSGLPYASENGACHACGHDLHSAMLYGACRLLKACEASLPGAVRAVFQCAEETAEGARALADSGILNAPPIRAAYALHVQPEMTAGRINCTSGWKMKSYDRFRITFTGRGGHGGNPHRAVDPIRAAAHTYLALETLPQTACAPAEQAVLSVGQFHGGTTANVIPETAWLEGTVRTCTQEGRSALTARVEKAAGEISAAFGVTARTEWQARTPPLYNDPKRTLGALASLRAAGLNADGDPMPLPFSEDFAVIAQLVPTAYLNLGARPSGEVRFNHDPAVLYDESVLPIGAAALAACALGGLTRS